MECGGQCLLTDSCSAFQFLENTCRLLDSTYLYRDTTDTSVAQIYMVDSDWAMRGTIQIFPLVNEHCLNKLNVFQLIILVLNYTMIVDTTWTLWTGWSNCDQICNTGDRHRDRQCPGSVPKGVPSKTAQYGGQRDCYGNSRVTHNTRCNTHYCNRM